MPTIQYPSEEFPPLAQVSVAVPDGWVPTQIPGCVVAARAPEGDGFRDNVTCSIERVTELHPWSDHVDAARRVIEALPNLVMNTDQDAERETFLAHVFEYAYSHDSGLTVIQITMLAATPVRPGVIDIARFTASAAPDEADREASIAQLRQLATDFRMAPQLISN